MMTTIGTACVVVPAVARISSEYVPGTGLSVVLIQSIDFVLVGVCVNAADTRLGTPLTLRFTGTGPPDP